MTRHISIFGGIKMLVPGDLKYSKTDEWIKVEGNTGTVGISDYAQSQLSDVVFVEIVARVGEDAKKGTICATIESVKAAADVNYPISGKVLEINDKLPDSPEIVNSDPYKESWIVKVQLSDPSELSSLMDAAAYEVYCQERTH
jgi:glycine cleavage system H protein